MLWYLCSSFIVISQLWFLDIDECVENTDGCAHQCTNTISSYYCSCDTGYSLESDNHGCQGRKSLLFHSSISNVIDINECLTNNGGCNQTCNNSIGSYSCSCDIGYDLAVDKHNCYGMFHFCQF